MSVRRWNTSFEREQLKMLTHTIALYESSHVAMFSPQEMGGVDEDDDNLLMSDSSSSSSSTTSSSSSSSSSTSSLSSVGNMSAMEEEDDLLNLVIMTQQLNRKLILRSQIQMCNGENQSTLMTYQSPSVSRIVE